MASFEHAEELAVGLYERGLSLPPKRRVIDIGTSRNLKNGWWSPWLVNLRPALSIDRGSDQSAEKQSRMKGLLLDGFSHALDMVEADNPAEHVFGPPETGTPVAAAITGRDGRSLLWRRIVAKEGYGAHELIEGAYYAGERVTMVDDVVTSGLTKREEAATLGEAGLGTGRLVVGADREQGGRQSIEDMGWKVAAVMGATDLFAALREAGHLTTSEHDYLVAYTVSPEHPTEDPMDHPWVGLQQ